MFVNSKVWYPTLRVTLGHDIFAWSHNPIALMTIPLANPEKEQCDGRDLNNICRVSLAILILALYV